jgi:hypothetical protein
VHSYTFYLCCIDPAGDPDPSGKVHGYVPPGKTEVRTIPLEILVKGDSAPTYGATTEDDARGYAATVMAFQLYYKRNTIVCFRHSTDIFVCSRMER